jgi:hypothetical protein
MLSELIEGQNLRSRRKRERGESESQRTENKNT